MLDRAVFADEQLLEQPLVEESALGRQGVAVLFAAEPCDFEGAFQLFVELLKGLFCNGDLSSSRIHFPGRAIHLLLQQVEGHGPGVVRLQQGRLLVPQRGVPSPSLTKSERGVGLALLQLVADNAADGVDPVGGEVKALVEVLNPVLDAGKADVLPRAGCRFGSAADAEKVLVDAALALVLAVDQSVAALAAVNGALEVLGVLAVLLARGVVRRENVLYPQPEVPRDERRVGAFVVAAVVDDDADVVRAGEQPVERRGRDGSTRTVLSSSVAESSRFQSNDEPLKAPIASCVLLECPADVGCPFLVDLDPTDVGAAFLALLVDVPEGCQPRGAALFELGSDALMYLGGEVVRVVGSDPAHELEVEEPLRRFVDVLSHRHQRCLRRFPRLVDDVVDLR